MLKQILRDMYVDPEILAGLDETHKQTLFCKMREEQIRRWKIWDEEQEKIENLNKKNKNLINNNNNENENLKCKSNNNKNKNKKRVTFKLGDDGEPWVWVMGEHPNDLTIEEILEEEAKQKARQLAENEFLSNVDIINNNYNKLNDLINIDDSNKNDIETDTDVKNSKSIVNNNTNIDNIDNNTELLLTNTNTKSKIKTSTSTIPLVNTNNNNNNIVNEILINETPKIEDFDIYCSVDELKEKISLKPTQSNELLIKNNNNNSHNNNYNQQLQQNNNRNNKNNTKFSIISSHNYKNINNDDDNKKFDVLQEIYYNKQSQSQSQSQSKKVSQRIALWEQRTIGQRTTEIFKQIQKKKQEVAKEAEEAAKMEEELWKEQERKSKQAEIQIREIARRAREEHRKSLSLNNYNNNSTIQKHQEQHDLENENKKNLLLNSKSNFNTKNSINNSDSTITSLKPLSLLSLQSRPENQNDVINWYCNIEFPKRMGINLLTNKPEIWFHGLLSRLEAENVLSNKTKGTYLIRISKQIWGYVISYKDTDRCKHYLIDASNSKYKFIGQNQKEHKTLDDLLRHHASVPITTLGNELLLQACPPTVEIPSILENLL